MPKKFEAKTLEEVYEKASLALDCSINDLDIEVIQSPSSGFLGFFAKKAIIEAKRKNNKNNHKKEYNNNKQDIEVETLTTQLNKLNNSTKKEDNKLNKNQVKKEKIFDDFYDRKKQEIHQTPIVKTDNENLKFKIKKEVDNLFSKICYEIDDIKVEVSQEEKMVYITFTGKDSALLIGKEGYRYKALSYILFNWINEKYNMMLKLEVAEFLANQEEAMNNYLVPVIEKIKEEGYFKTKILDGILIHIALTKLREEFPKKYVAVKTTQKGDKYILINEYRK